MDKDPQMALTNIAKIGGRKRHARKTLKNTGGTDVEIVEMELLQDKTSLRSRKGDTGMSNHLLHHDRLTCHRKRVMACEVGLFRSDRGELHAHETATAALR